MDYTDRVTIVFRELTELRKHYQMTKSTMPQAGPHVHATMHLRMLTDEMLLQYLGNALENRGTKITSLKRKCERLEGICESLKSK